MPSFKYLYTLSEILTFLEGGSLLCCCSWSYSLYPPLKVFLFWTRGQRFKRIQCFIVCEALWLWAIYINKLVLTWLDIDTSHKIIMENSRAAWLMFITADRTVITRQTWSFSAGILVYSRNHSWLKSGLLMQHRGLINLCKMRSPVDSSDQTFDG